MVNCAFFVSGFIFLIDSCKALLIIYHVKRRYIKWKLLLLLYIDFFSINSLNIYAKKTECVQKVPLMSLQTRRKRLNIAVIRLIHHSKNYPRGKLLANNTSRQFGRHLSLRAMRLAAALAGTSSTISQGSINLREFPVKRR